MSLFRCQGVLHPGISIWGGCVDGVCFGWRHRECVILGIPLPGLAVWLVRAGVAAEGFGDFEIPYAFCGDSLVFFVACGIGNRKLLKSLCFL